MSIEALTTSTSGHHLDPASATDGLDWVSATATRNFLLSNPLVDWLELYGEQHRFVKDSDLPGFDERLEFVLLIVRKGVEFEAAIAQQLSSLAHMTTIAHNRDDTRDLGAAEQTFHALCEGKPILHQAALRDAATRTYGTADFLVRSDVFTDLFPGHLSSDEVAAPALDLGDDPWHYIVIDAKFTTLHRLWMAKLATSGGPARTNPSCTYTTGR